MIIGNKANRLRCRQIFCLTEGRNVPTDFTPCVYFFAEEMRRHEDVQPDSGTYQPRLVRGGRRESGARASGRADCPSPARQAQADICSAHGQRRFHRRGQL